MTKTLIIGATGYVGRSIAQALIGRGCDTHGLARTSDSAASLRAAGVKPVGANADDLDALAASTRGFDALVIAAKPHFAAEAAIVQALTEAFRGEGRTLIFTSGTGVLSIGAREGQWDENSFAEDDPFPFPALGVRRARLPIEEDVRAASGGGYRTMVIRLPLVWGLGGSDHVPEFFKSAKDHGAVWYLGQGLNVISNVHVDDVAELYALALEKGAAGGLYHAVAGEVAFRTIAEAVAAVAGCEARSGTFDEMCALFGRDWVNTGLAINSRTRAARSRADLGWTPRRPDLIEDIRNGSYRAA